MPRRVKVTDTIFARGVSHLAADINAIEEQHKIMPADLTRGLLEAACAFYREHGWFSFPVVILPKKFHLEKCKGRHCYPEAQDTDPMLNEPRVSDLGKEELRRRRKKRDSGGSSGDSMSGPEKPS